MLKKKLPIGISDFKDLISNDYYFVDKSLLIKEVLDSRAAVTLIPRPRRFGKTLNLSMLRYFFEKTEKSNRKLFDNLAISKKPEYMEHQGKYPVIYLTFKDVKDVDWEGCYENLVQIIADEFARHEYLLQSEALRPFEKSEFEKIINSTANSGAYKRSIRKLSFYLHKHYKQKPMIFLDEYDAPINAGFTNRYYKEVINFMRRLLSGGLKDNSDLEFSVLTGILKVAKESIFSDMNNLKVCSILDKQYSDKFGLLESEVHRLIKGYDLTASFKKITKWYNGYIFWQHIIYNPWSIINFVDNEGVFQPYWINTSQNKIIKELMQKSSDKTKIEIEQLIRGESLTKPTFKNIVLSEALAGDDSVWSFLLFSGYLTFNKQELIKRTWYANMLIPNEEVLSFYETTISNWFKQGIIGQKYNETLEALITGNIEAFGESFSEFVIKSFSYFDVKGNEPEKFYHAFVLGLLVTLQNTHHVKSNRESGYGRYDVTIIPKDITKPGIIIEFKKTKKLKKETLEQAAKNALKQIEEKKYEQELKELGIKKIVKLAIVFDGKSVFVKTTPD